jgi:periplasmic protein TonB
VKTRLFSFRHDYPCELSRCPYQQTDFKLEDTMVEQSTFELARLEPATLEPAMFANSMLEVSWAHRSRRSWTALTSFGLQTVIVSLLLLVPLLRTVVLPSGHALPTPISWGTPPPAAPPIRHQHVMVIQSNLAENVLIAPKDVTKDVEMLEGDSAPPQVSYNGVGVDGGLGAGSRDGVLNSLGDASTRGVLPPPPPVSSVRQFRTSSMLQGSLIHSVQPIYPPLARTARIQGSVVLSAIIGKDGMIKNLRAVSGHPMLVSAAVNAVSQWRYRPYILNNEAIEVETLITVNFTLSGN